MHLLYLVVFMFLHDLHLSLCEIKHNAQSSSLEITHKVFIDDLEAGMEKHFKKEFHLASPQEKAEEEKYIEKYIKEHFLISINGKVQNYQYWGREYDHEAAWIYFEVYNLETIKQIEVKNTILLPLHEDQNNILNLNYGGKIRTMRFKKAHESEELVY